MAYELSEADKANISSLLLLYRRHVKDLPTSELHTLRRMAAETLAAGGQIKVVHVQGEGFRFECVMPAVTRSRKRKEN